MKLSEAIRLGAMLRPQSFKAGFDGVGTCAWGAAFEAAGYTPIATKYGNKWIPEWGTHPFHALFEERQFNCPACHKRECTGSIVHLNDDHRWTREQIADWVETLEAQVEQEAAKDNHADHAIQT